MCAFLRCGGDLLVILPTLSVGLSSAASVVSESLEDSAGVYLLSCVVCSIIYGC